MHTVSYLLFIGPHLLIILFYKTQLSLRLLREYNESLRAVTFISIINQLEICKAFISEMYPYPRI